jgi:uroporphyrinogen-III decarboxylase
MKATILLALLTLVALLAFVAAPVTLASATTMAGGHTSRADELVWMLISGATLLGVASAVRRYVP